MKLQRRFSGSSDHPAGQARGDAVRKQLRKKAKRARGAKLENREKSKAPARITSRGFAYFNVYPP